jgi:hypothetical protein
MSIVTAILDIWSGIGSWITEMLQQIVALFWTTGASGGGELTFFGTLAVVSIGISVFFLLLRVLQNFIKLRS